MEIKKIARRVKGLLQVIMSRDRFSAADRKLRTRRFILMGSYMEHLTAKDEAAKDRLMKGLDGFLDRDRDRDLFDLPSKPDSIKKAVSEAPTRPKAP